jgi:hypothetical protein
MSEQGEDGPLDSRSPAPGRGGARGMDGAFAPVRGGGQREGAAPAPATTAASGVVRGEPGRSAWRLRGCRRGVAERA